MPVAWDEPDCPTPTKTQFRTKKMAAHVWRKRFLAFSNQPPYQCGNHWHIGRKK